MAIEVNGKTYRYYPYDAFYVNGTQVKEAYFNGVKYYPEQTITLRLLFADVGFVDERLFSGPIDWFSPASNTEYGRHVLEDIDYPWFMSLDSSTWIFSQLSGSPSTNANLEDWFDSGSGVVKIRRETLSGSTNGVLDTYATGVISRGSRILDHTWNSFANTVTLNNLFSYENSWSIENKIVLNRNREYEFYDQSNQLIATYSDGTITSYIGNVVGEIVNPQACSSDYTYWPDVTNSKDIYAP